MKLTLDMTVHDLLEAYPFLLEALPRYQPKFDLLKNKVARATMARVATLKMAAGLGGVAPERFLADLQAMIHEQTGEKPELDAQPGLDDRASRVAALKAIIRGLHDGEDLTLAKQQFTLLLHDVKPDEIREFEEQLVKEGMPVAEVQRLCDLHVGVFKGALDAQPDFTVPPGHPVHTYQLENQFLTQAVSKLDALLKQIGFPPEPARFNALKPQVQEALDQVGRLEVHYVRKENQLFPHMEKHGITTPPQVMWGVHDTIRLSLKQARAALEAGDFQRFSDQAVALSRDVVEMVYKEEKILFPLVLKTFSEGEWGEILKGEGAIGYIVPPAGPGAPVAAGVAANAAVAAGTLSLATGALTLEQINLMLTRLPLDVSFVDEHDEVRYYSEGRERLFPRSPAVIGRKVQNCHPPKSVHTVEKILAAFKDGSRDVAEFWIDMQGKKIHIRYFALRDAGGAYRGTLEVSQDITGIQALAGQKRLLDWEG